MECYNLLASVNNSVSDDEDNMMMMMMMMTTTTMYLKQPYWSLGTYSERAVI